MARIVWRYNYRGTNARYRYYGTPASTAPWEVPLEAFLINHLNTSRQRLILGMSNIRRASEAIVRTRSRVDTGAMKAQVTGTGDFGTDILKISFGWNARAPYYAVFQEFGTRTGIRPMMAVHAAYHYALPELSKLVRR